MFGCLIITLKPFWTICLQFDRGLLRTVCKYYLRLIKYDESNVKLKENRIYIRMEFTRKKCKTAILLYCFHTAGILHIFMPYNLLGPGIPFYRKSKITVKRKPNYEIGWLTNDHFTYNLCLPLYKRWFSVITINQMMFLFT